MEPEHQYLLAIITPLISHPSDLKIDRTLDQRGIFLSMTAHGEDMGKLIGKDGETARSIRRLLRQYGMKNKMRISLKINEPVVGRKEQADPIM